MKIIERVFDSTTGTSVDIERELTDIEIAEMEKAQAEAAARAVEQAEKETARQALLAKLGITEEEAKLLLS